MTTTEHPQPPAPLADHFTAVVGALDSLLAATGDATDGLAGLAGHELSADLHATALTNLRGIATACDLDWDDLMAERDRRAVVAE